MDIFTHVLKSPELLGQTDHTQRLSIINANLFQTVFRRVSRGMLHADKVLLALLLMRVHIRGISSEPNYDIQWDLLLGRSELFTSKSVVDNVKVPDNLKFLNSTQVASLVKTSKLPGFNNVKKFFCFNLIVLARREHCLQLC